MAIWIVLGLAVVIVLYVIATYNSLVKSRNRVKNAWAQIDVQLQRRLDLIPNLVETVKGYAKHEASTLEKVVEARNSVAAATSPAEKIEANDRLSGFLRNFFALSEAYPDLKANQNFQQLQSELKDTEDKISYMRQSYNDVVMKYNTQIETFPVNLVAGAFGFTESEFLRAVEEASQAPKVQF